jgi:hypothetical protein
MTSPVLGRLLQLRARQIKPVRMMTFSGGRRLRMLSHDYGNHYAHLIHVGAGWAFARLRDQPGLVMFAILEEGSGNGQVL